MDVTHAQLQKIMPYASSIHIDEFLPYLNAAMSEFGITTPERQAAFLANVAIESGSLRYVVEIADGKAYEGRKDLGNTQPGDGPKFRGRGLLQITGRANYAACGEALKLDLLHHPELLERPVNACRSAGWVFANYKKLNALADQKMITAICRTINGGSNGLKDRLACWKVALNVLDA